MLRISLALRRPRIEHNLPEQIENELMKGKKQHNLHGMLFLIFDKICCTELTILNW
jgi:hypothetical protein